MTSEWLDAFLTSSLHQTYEWSDLSSGCGPRTVSFSSFVGDIEHDAEESLEDQAI